MAGPYAGFGATLSLGGVPTVAVRDINGPGMVTTAIDTSSRASKARTFLPGMYDAGELTFDILYDPDAASHIATAAGIVGLQQAGTVVTGILTFPDTSPATCTFTCFVTGTSIKSPMDDALTADVTVKISGAPVWA
jgi:hypothetical protein